MIIPHLIFHRIVYFKVDESIKLFLSQLSKFNQLWLEEGFIDNLCSIRARIKHPNIENNLHEIVSRKEEKNNSEQFVESSEKSKDNPVG